MDRSARLNGAHMTGGWNATSKTLPDQSVSSVQFSQMATPRAGRKIPGNPHKLHCKRTSAACGIMGMCGTISPTSSEELLRVEWTAPHASTGRT